MANISSEIDKIENATRGEEVRDAIVSAIRKMNRQLEPPSDD